MPYRKYKPKKGRYGDIYHVVRGISVCKNEADNWLVKLNIKGERKNKTVGKGRDSLIKAIRMAEKLSGKLTEDLPLSTGEVAVKEDEDTTPIFADYGKSWLENNSGRWRQTDFI